MHKKRTYRNLIKKNNLVSFNVVVKETDLFIHADKILVDKTTELVLKYRGYVESYISRYPEFEKTLKPWQINGPAPSIVRDMVNAGIKAGVGPMAAVAGAIAEYVGLDLLSFSDEVVVENGGDIFLKTNEPLKVAVFAGKSPLSLRIGFLIDSMKKPAAVCTSSGTVGHSLSLGNADAVCVLSESCSLADAAATSIGNHIKSKSDIPKAIDIGKNINGINGIAIIMGDEIGLWGNLELIPVNSRVVE
ncbi:MAG: UPF0280 family protein [Proteobacteria bacterium]|nr:UPF0280 family protein [Pseudomonadota bacterium]MBU4126856.1 UPF0280 family protein [Pseudomonadota bacterium]